MELAYAANFHVGSTQRMRRLPRSPPRLTVLTTNSPQRPRKEGLNEKKQLVQAMELAGLEPATSWVRSRRSPN
jgi:hypothetical protein